VYGVGQAQPIHGLRNLLDDLPWRHLEMINNGIERRHIPASVMFPDFNAARVD
jgi:hypothetical protein